MGQILRFPEFFEEFGFPAGVEVLDLPEQGNLQLIGGSHVRWGLPREGDHPVGVEVKSLGKTNKSILSSGGHRISVLQHEKE